MSLQSLDPRIRRWDLPGNWEDQVPKQALDQFQTFEVFHQKREQTPFAYAGPVHAPDLEVAFLYAKEQHSRRFSCTGLWVVKTQDVQVTAYVGDTESVYQVAVLPESAGEEGGPEQPFEVFHLKKRGKAHTHAGTVVAPSYRAALARAREQFGDGGGCVNVWIVPAARIMRARPGDLDMWATTPEKKYREPAAYKVLDMITAFKNQGLQP
ncbi:MAG: phenylacetic acid degradation b [Adhaeribacter sp.]